MKDGGHHYFISSLDVAEPGMSADSRAQAAFVLAVICDGHRRGRLVCAEQGLLQKLLSLLTSMVRASFFGLDSPCLHHKTGFDPFSPANGHLHRKGLLLQLLHMPFTRC